MVLSKWERATKSPLSFVSCFSLHCGEIIGFCRSTITRTHSLSRIAFSHILPFHEQKVELRSNKTLFYCKTLNGFTGTALLSSKGLELGYVLLFDTLKSNFDQPID